MPNFKDLTIPRVSLPHGLTDPKDVANVLNQLVKFSQAVDTVLNGLILNGQIQRVAQDAFALGGTGAALPVANGGTGRNTLTAHAVLLGEGTSPVGFAGPGAALTLLQGNGASADPTFTLTPVAGTSLTIGDITTGSGTLKIYDAFPNDYARIISSHGIIIFSMVSTTFNGFIAGHLSYSDIDSRFVITGQAGKPSAFRLSEDTANGTDTVTVIAPASIPSSFNFVLPADAGTAGQVLTSQGGGTTPMTWTTVSSGSAAGSTIPGMDGQDGEDYYGGMPLGDIIAAGGPTGSSSVVPVISYDNKGRLTAVTTASISGTAPGGSAGGDLTGTYPNPTIAAAAQRNIARQAIYKPFTVGANDDEFDDASFTGWTLVNDGTHLATNTEDNDVLSISLPGSDTAAHLQAYMKTLTVNIGDIIEACFSGSGVSAASVQVGLIFADGTTYGAGNQTITAYSPASSAWTRNLFTNYNSDGGGATANAGGPFGNNVFMRLKYSAANTFIAYASSDGLSWAQTLTWNKTMTPSAAGFFATSWGATTPYIWTVRYWRKTT